MTKHKTEDYKISAVKYYLNNDKGDGYKKTCKIFDCKKSTLRDWIKRYNSSKNLYVPTYNYYESGSASAIFKHSFPTFEEYCSTLPLILLNL